MSDRDRPLIDVDKVDEIGKTFNRLYALIYRDNYNDYAYLKIIESKNNRIRVN